MGHIYSFGCFPFIFIAKYRWQYVSIIVKIAKFEVHAHRKVRYKRFKDLNYHQKMAQCD